MAGKNKIFAKGWDARLFARMRALPQPLKALSFACYYLIVGVLLVIGGSILFAKFTGNSEPFAYMGLTFDDYKYRVDIGGGNTISAIKYIDSKNMDYVNFNQADLISTMKTRDTFVRGINTYKVSEILQEIMTKLQDRGVRNLVQSSLYFAALPSVLHMNLTADSRQMVQSDFMFLCGETTQGERFLAEYTLKTTDKTATTFGIYPIKNQYSCQQAIINSQNFLQYLAVHDQTMLNNHDPLTVDSANVADKIKELLGFSYSVILRQNVVNKNEKVSVFHQQLPRIEFQDDYPLKEARVGYYTSQMTIAEQHNKVFATCSVFLLADADPGIANNMYFKVHYADKNKTKYVHIISLGAVLDKVKFYL